VAKAKIPKPEFYLHDEVELLAPLFLNKYLMTNTDGHVTGGRIVEVEAYAGRGRDKACHAHNKRTSRNESMFLKGGHAYIYLCYGLHNLFNIVTNVTDTPDAILVRAIEPTEGLDVQLRRRKRSRLEPDVGNGPGKVGQALGLTVSQDKLPLSGPEVWIEDRGETADAILAGKRIGIDYAGKDVNLPWRFATDSRFVGHRKHLKPQ
jgi:DNA-3-methyladenine glycosylase